MVNIDIKDISHRLRGLRWLDDRCKCAIRYGEPPMSQHNKIYGVAKGWSMSEVVCESILSDYVRDNVIAIFFITMQTNNEYLKNWKHNS